MSIKSLFNKILATVFLAIAIGFLAFLSFLLLLFLSTLLCWLFDVNTDRFYAPGIISFVLTASLLIFIYYKRYSMSENLIKKEDMAIWPIAYTLLALPILIPLFVIVIAKPLLHKIDLFADNKVESVVEMAKRWEDVKDGSIVMDTVAIERDVEKIHKNAALDWQDVTDKRAGFTSKFPQGSIDRKTVPSEVADMPDAVLYTMSMKDQTNINSGYWIASYQIPLGSSMNAMFDEMEQQLSKNAEAVLYAKDAQVSGYIARDLKIKVSSFRIMHVRIAYYRSSMYVIRVVAPIDNADNESVAYFFNSFQPL